MYRLLTSLPVGELVTRQAPIFLTAFVLAELFFKFGSFALECGAFLGTWFLIDAAVERLAPRHAEGDR
jgi:hypothetical protein